MTTSTPCPSPVTPTIEQQIQYWSDGELSIVVATTDDPLVQDVTIQVVDPSNWLVYVWFIDSEDVTSEDTATPPTVPGVSSFYKVSDSSGKIEFEISNDATPWEGYVCAVVVGRVNRSDVIVVGA